MTDSELIIIILLFTIFVLLLAILSSISTKTDKEIVKLLKQICNNTRDKTVPVKPVNVSVTKSKITKWATCPICGELIHNEKKHCEKCGAELDWSDIE